MLKKIGLISFNETLTMPKLLCCAVILSLSALCHSAKDTNSDGNDNRLPTILEENENENNTLILPPPPTEEVLTGIMAELARNQTAPPIPPRDDDAPKAYSSGGADRPGLKTTWHKNSNNTWTVKLVALNCGNPPTREHKCTEDKTSRQKTQQSKASHNNRLENPQTTSCQLEHSIIRPLGIKNSFKKTLQPSLSQSQQDQPLNNDIIRPAQNQTAQINPITINPYQRQNKNIDVEYGEEKNTSLQLSSKYRLFFNFATAIIVTIKIIYK